MDIVSFVANYSLDDVLAIEEKDTQNQAIKHAWEKIREKYGDEKYVRNSFLYVLLQTALISYQIAGSGPLWWDEITQKIFDDFDHVLPLLFRGECIGDWRYNTMVSSSYNKRLYNNKYKRLVRFFDSYDQYFCVQKKDYQDFYKNMDGLLDLLTKSMKTKRSAKTMTFAVKIFGYGARRVYDDFRLFPHSISIPLDSRLRAIGKHHFGSIDDAALLTRLDDLGAKHGIPPLHLDSLLWIEYWNKYM